MEKKENNKKECQLIRKGESLKIDGEKISFELFKSFIYYSGGTIFLVQLALTNIIWQISQIYREYYLAKWSSQKDITKSENNISQIQSQKEKEKKKEKKKNKHEQKEKKKDKERKNK